MRRPISTNRIPTVPATITVILVLVVVNFFDGPWRTFGVPVFAFVSIGLLLFSRRKPIESADTGQTNSFDTPLVAQVEKTTAEDVSDVPLSVLGQEYRRKELADTERIVDDILANCIRLTRAHIRAHTVAVLFPTNDGGYKIRKYVSECEHIDTDAVIYPGKGLIGSFLKDGLKQLKLQDIVTDSMTLYYYTRDAGIRSLMASPISAEGVERAVLLVDSTEKNRFSDEDHAFLSALADLCGLAVYYAYLYNQHKLDHSRLVAMSGTEKHLFQRHDVSSVLDKMTELIPFAFRCERMTISLKNTETGEGRIERAWGVDAEELSGLHFPLDSKSLAAVLYSKNLCLSRNFSEEHYEIRYSEKEPRRKELSSFLAYPVGVEECIGAVFLESVNKDAFPESSRDLLARLTTSAGIAIERIQVLERTECLATHDGLTGLYNHREFQRQLKEAITRSLRYETPLSLVICDLDHFKKLNDTYGHRFGDLVLKTISTKLQSSIREGIDTAARYGGEEFALVLEKLDSSGALELVERIRGSFGVFQTPNGKEVSVSMSFGIAEYGVHARKQELLIQRADKALYRAKENGRNRAELYYEPETSQT